MRNNLSISILLSACFASTPYAFAEKTNLLIDKQATLLAEASDVPEGYQRMPDGTLMPSSSSTSITIDDLGGILPTGFHVMHDGTVMANTPANAIAPEGYELKTDGTLILMSSQNHQTPGGVLLSQNIDSDSQPPVMSQLPTERTWTLEYKYSRINKQDLKDANSKVSPIGVFYSPYQFDAAPSKMTIDKHTFMLLYGFSSKISLMGMFHYLVNDMELLLDDTSGQTTSLHSSGIGDTTLSVAIKIPHNLEFGFGVSIPTGSIHEAGTMGRIVNNVVTPISMKYPYSMQTGSGTVDVTPSVAYRNAWHSFEFGGKLGYTMRTKKNHEHYRLGNEFEVNGFIDWNLHKNIAANFKTTLISEEKIDGEVDPDLLFGPNGKGSPDAHPSFYGGTRIDLGIGAKIKTTDQMVYLKPEFSIPIYQSLWGPQLRTSWNFCTSIGALF